MVFQYKAYILNVLFLNIFFCYTLVVCFLDIQQTLLLQYYDREWPVISPSRPRTQPCMTLHVTVVSVLTIQDSIVREQGQLSPQLPRDPALHIPLKLHWSVSRPTKSINISQSGIFMERKKFPKNVRKFKLQQKLVVM